MRLLLQRVAHASVTVDRSLCGRIDKGILVLLGIHKEDDGSQIPWLAEKLCALRIFPDAAGKMNRSVQDIEGGILVVSQFTLYGTASKGRRPEFTQAMGGEHARTLYQRFLDHLQDIHPVVESGRFAAHMDVELLNDGPVTLLLERGNCS